PCPEMTIDQIQEIPRAEQLHPSEADEVRGEDRRQRPERERAEDPVSKRFALMRFGQPQHEHGQHHCVVGAQQPFERDEQRDSDQIGDLRHVLGQNTTAEVDTLRIKSYTWIDASRWVSTTTFFSSAWRRGCSGCIRRHYASTNVWAWCSLRERSAACGCTHARSSNG